MVNDQWLINQSVVTCVDPTHRLSAANDELNRALNRCNVWTLLSVSASENGQVTMSSFPRIPLLCSFSDKIVFNSPSAASQSRTAAAEMPGPVMTAGRLLVPSDACWTLRRTDVRAESS